MTIDYRRATSELRAAWFAYKQANPGRACSLVDFAAGWNAAKEVENPGSPGDSTPPTGEV